MIIGVGVDAVDIERIDRLVQEYGERFLRRVYTEKEIEYAFLSTAKLHERLAGRFAVKEAVLKVLGTGKSGGILWKDVETLRGPGGKPRVMLHGKAKEHADNLGISAVHVSISHDGKMALSFVIAEGEIK
ncbi:MAG: holo-ACP synthase [Deltaproteobacteria bacterium]|nr:holo-ACP synthase [Deltaproteobacteria bacterium]